MVVMVFYLMKIYVVEGYVYYVGMFHRSVQKMQGTVFFPPNHILFVLTCAFKGFKVYYVLICYLGLFLWIAWLIYFLEKSIVHACLTNIFTSLWFKNIGLKIVVCMSQINADGRSCCYHTSSRLV